MSRAKNLCESMDVGRRYRCGLALGHDGQHEFHSSSGWVVQWPAGQEYMEPEQRIADLETSAAGTIANVGKLIALVEQLWRTINAEQARRERLERVVVSLYQATLGIDYDGSGDVQAICRDLAAADTEVQHG